MHRHLQKKIGLIIVALGLILFTNPSHAKDIEGYADLMKFYADELSEEQQLAFRQSIQSAEERALADILKKEITATLAERQYMLRQSESVPTKIFEINEKFIAIGFEKTLLFKGNWEKAAFVLLFEVRAPQDLNYSNNYLFLKGKSSLKEYSDISISQLCQNFSTLTQVVDCGKESTTTVARVETQKITPPTSQEPPATKEPLQKPQETAKAKEPSQKLPEPSEPKEVQEPKKVPQESKKDSRAEELLAKKMAAMEAQLRWMSAAIDTKAEREHFHSGKDITAGIIQQNFIDAAIARDREFQNAPEGVPVGDVDDTYVKTLENRIMELENTVHELSSVLKGVSRDKNNIVLSRVNLQIVNGSGSTDGNINGMGNLIVGYNRPRDGFNETERLGSHNIIVGDEHNYTSYGGLVAGSSNTISGAYSSVTGGLRNVASGDYSVVSGGHFRTAEGVYSEARPGSAKPEKKEKNGGGCFLSLLKGTYSESRPASNEPAKEEKLGGCGAY